METAVLFEQYGRKVYRVILRLVDDPQEAEDLTQETFLKVHRNLSTLRDERKAASWLYRIATTVALDRLPEQYRLALLLHDLEGLSVEEVAEITGSSVTATKTRLHRARKRMATLCSQECEQFHNEEGVIACQPRSVQPVASGTSDCCSSEDADCSCL